MAKHKYIGYLKSGDKIKTIEWVAIRLFVAF